MVAKPIVDMVAGVATLDDADNMVSAMASIGYDYPGDIGIPDHRIFGRDPGFRKFLVHVVAFNGERWSRYIDFREALRRDAGMAADYGRIKQRIAAEHPEGRATYTELKSRFIREVLENGR